MASGGLLNVAEEGPHCIPCMSKDKKVAFHKFCLDCEAYYCVDCFELHPRVPVLAKHTVLRTEDVRRWSRIPYKCKIHGRNIEFFCRTHNKLVCQICINLQHRQCDSLDFIPECSKEIGSNQKLKSTVEQIGNIIETANHFEENFEKKSQTNHNSRESFLKHLSDFRHAINGMLDDLERATKESMEKQFEDNARFFNASITELRKLKNELEELKSDLKTTSKEKEVLVYIRLTEGIETVEEAERKIAKLNSKNNKEQFKLVIDGKLEQLLKSLTSFGSIVDEQNMASDELPSSVSVKRSSAVVRSSAFASESFSRSFSANQAKQYIPSKSYQSAKGGGSNLQIFVRLPDCTSVILNVGKDETIENVKRKLIQKEGSRCPANFYLTYGSERLPEDNTVSDCEIKANYNLHLHSSIEQNLSEYSEAAL